MSTSAQRRKRRQESRPRRQAADGPPEPDLDLLPAGVAAAGRAPRPIASRRRGTARQARRPDAPDEERALMDLYPQPRGREAAFEYVPARTGERAPSRHGQATPPA